MATVMKREKEKPQSIQVFVRVRPLNRQERESRSYTCLEVAGARELLIKQQHNKKYTFDGVFGPSVKQLTVYETIVKQLIAEILAGYNCTVFAYGQTGTGKTYTMAGGSATSSTSDVRWQDDAQAGIIPRALAHLFDELRLIQQEYTVRVSYLELYNEELYDLLSDGDDTARIRIYDDQRQKGSVIIQGVEEQTVHSKYEVYKILEKGQEKRRTASTLMNAQSSRSHTVFSITVHTRETTPEGEELVKTGKLHLVDLAGSENISRSGAVDRRAREAGSINQSLLNLGRVIKALVEKSPHIPYRASKLTRILQDSLGGRTKTSIIATISPAVSSLDETLSTLDYANRARNITNRPEINQKMSQKALMSQYVDEVERLRKDLSAARTGTGVYLAHENYLQLVADKQMSSDELAEKVTVIRDLEQQIKSVEDEKHLMEQRWASLQQSFDETNHELAKCREKLQQTLTEKKEQEHLAACYAETAGALHEQAEALLNMTKSSTFNEAVLREKVENLYASAIANNEAVKKVSASVGGTCRNMQDELVEFMHAYYDSNKNLVDTVQNMQEMQVNTYKITTSLTNSMEEQIKNALSEFNLMVQNQERDTGTWMNELFNKLHGYVKTIHDLQKWNNTQLYQYLGKMLNTEKKQHENMCDRMEKQFKDVYAKMNPLSLSIRDDIENIKVDLLEELSKLENIWTMQEGSTDESKFKVLNWYQNTLQALENTRQTLDEGFKNINETFDHTSNVINPQGIEKLKAIKKKVDYSLPNFQKEVETGIEELEKTVSACEHIIEETKSKRPMVTLQDSLIQDFYTDKKMREELTEVELQKNFKEVNASGKLLVDECSNALSQMKFTLENQVKNVLALQNMQKETNKEAFHDFKSESNNILQTLTTNKKLVLQYEAVFSTKLHKCQENLNKFSNSEVVEIKHGGDTPARTNYVYPTSLKHPSPKDSILSRYRKEQQEKAEYGQSPRLPTIAESSNLGQTSASKSIVSEPTESCSLSVPDPIQQELSVVESEGSLEAEGDDPVESEGPDPVESESDDPVAIDWSLSSSSGEAT